MIERILVYGGSFNPFCVHHQQIIQWLVSADSKSNLVIVVPAANHALKPKLSNYKDRLRMVQLGVQELPNHVQQQIIVSDIECELLQKTDSSPVFTYDVLIEIQKIYPECKDIQFAIGPDIFQELHLWNKVPEIRERFGFYKISENLNRGIRATNVRAMISNKDRIWESHVPLTVRSYIINHALYQEMP